jgi:hypothetical protein
MLDRACALAMLAMQVVNNSSATNAANFVFIGFFIL